MKDKYLKSKKYLRSSLSLVVVCLFLGISGILAKQFVLATTFILGFIVSLIISILLQLNIKKIEKYCLKQCPICNKEIQASFEDRYYIGDSLTTEEKFNESLHFSTKKVMHIEYYKCVECKFCMTVISFYVIKNGTKKEISKKTNLDFSYDGSY